MVIVPLSIQAQTISTDPANPVNTERPELKNKFNWMDRNWTVYHPDGHYLDGSNNPISIGNPYYKREFYHRHFNLYNYPTSLTQAQEAAALYFHPSEGWELLYKNNGLDPNGNKITDPLLNRIGPYYMFYNRYKGVLRVLASFDGISMADKMQTTLRVKNIQGLNVNAILNYYGASAQPLDQKTDVLEVAQVSDFASNRGFVSADFQMSYDPCNCNKKSELETTFSLVDSANIKLEGRMVGISTHLDATGKSPLLNRQSFMTDVYKDGFTVKGGSITYHNIDSLVKKYKQYMPSPYEAGAIEIFKKALSKGADVLDDKVLGKGVAVLFDSLFKGFPYYEDQSSVGLGIMAAGAKALSAELFPEHKVPDISFIEAEMALTGTLTDKTALNNGTNTIVVPGSLNSKTAAWQYYPTYNKPLGLFALLETPKVIRSSTYNYSSVGYNYKKRYLYKYKFVNSLKYTFNPNADINVDKTYIYVALVISSKKLLLNSYRNLQLIDFFKASDKEVYITPFVPIEYLQYIIPEKLYKSQQGRNHAPYNVINDSSIIDVKLRIMIEYEFNKNSYGKINKTLQIYNYPVTIVDGEDANTSFQDIRTMQMDIKTTSNIGNSSMHELSWIAWDTIQISHSVQTINPVMAKNIFKANTIILQPGAKINAGTVFKNGLPFADQQPINQVSSTEVSSFCTNKYQAYLSNQPALKSGVVQDNEDVSSVIRNNTEEIDEECRLTIYPNPNRGNFILSGLCKEKYQLIITDIRGTIVLQKTIDGKSFNNSITLTNVNPGIYMVKIVAGAKVHSQKLIITQ